jgi:hypothetical protein
MFGQDHDGVDGEGMIVHRISKCPTQQYNVLGGTQERTSVVRDNRKEKG